MCIELFILVIVPKLLKPFLEQLCSEIHGLYIIHDGVLWAADFNWVLAWISWVGYSSRHHFNRTLLLYSSVSSHCCGHCKGMRFAGVVKELGINSSPASPAQLSALARLLLPPSHGWASECEKRGIWCSESAPTPLGLPQK